MVVLSYDIEGRSQRNRKDEMEQKGQANQLPLTSPQKTMAGGNQREMSASAVLYERSGPMPRSKFSTAQIVYAIRQADAGTPVGDLCWQLYVSDA